MIDIRFDWFWLIILFLLVVIGIYYWLVVAYPTCMGVFDSHLYCLVRG